MQKPKMWTQLEQHRFDAAFATKLADEEGWSLDHSLRVIEEYRRFLYLTHVSAVKLTPSHAIDRAWHMHLTFTRNYWDVLCRTVLQKPLHHEPGGPGEGDRFLEQYRHTRQLYEQEFGEAPPAEIWPDPAGAARGIHPAKSMISVGFAGIVMAAIAYSADLGVALVIFIASIGAILLGSAMLSERGEKRPKSKNSSSCGPACASSCGSSCGGD